MENNLENKFLLANALVVTSIDTRSMLGLTMSLIGVLGEHLFDLIKDHIPPLIKAQNDFMMNAVEYPMIDMNLSGRIIAGMSADIKESLDLLFEYKDEQPDIEIDEEMKDRVKVIIEMMEQITLSFEQYVKKFKEAKKQVVDSPENLSYLLTKNKRYDA